MRLGQVFDVKNLPEADNFEPIPAGKYQATIEKVDVKETKSGTGQYLNIQWKITGPTHAGRIIFDMINFRNASVKAQEIGLRQLSTLLAAIGVPRVEDSDQLVGYSAEIKVSIDESPGHSPSNRVKSYKALEGSKLPPAPAAPAAAASTSASASAERKAPWQK